MARIPKTVYMITDDLTGEEVAEEDVESVVFSYDGSTYELDLSKANAKTFRELLAPYRDAGRKVSRNSRFPKSAVERGARSDLKKVREWASQNGFHVAPRGIIKKDVLDAYDKAH